MKHKPHKTIKRGSVSIPIYKNLIGNKYRYQVVWTDNGKKKYKTRTDEQEAVKLAEQMASELSKHGTPEKRVISRTSYQALCRLSKLADGDMHAFLSELEAAKKHLGEANWVEAARFWHSHAPDNFEEKLVLEVFEEYMKLFEDRPQKARSGVKSKLGKFVHSFGREYIGLITTKQIETWLGKLPGSKAYANKIRAEVITFYRRAQRWGYLPEGVVAPAKIPPYKVERKEPAIFTISKAQEVLENVRTDCIPYVAIGLFAGLRPFELAFPGDTKSLRWEDIDFKKGYIKVRAEVDGKNQTTRYVKMSQNLIEWLLPHRKKIGKIAMTRSASIVSKDLREKGVITAWENDIMRHSFCSYLLAKEQNIGLVAEQAGNSPEMIKKHYRRPVTEEEGDEWFNIRPQHGAEEEAGVA